MINKFDHRYCWGNNPVRAKYKGKDCRVVSQGKMNSIMVEFEDGFSMITSRYSVRRKKNENKDSEVHCIPTPYSFNGD